MNTIKFPVGHINEACKKLVEAAKASGEPTALTFNGLELVATPHTDPSALADSYMLRSQARYDYHQRRSKGENA